MNIRGLIYLSVLLLATIVFETLNPTLRGLNLFLQGILLLSCIRYLFQLKPTVKVFAILKGYFCLFVLLIINYNFSNKSFVIYLFSNPYQGCFFALLIMILLLTDYWDHSRSSVK
jgi:hypothetical protein